jgi:hypothetical protein
VLPPNKTVVGGFSVCMLLIIPFVLQPTAVMFTADAADCPILTRMLPLTANVVPKQLSCAGIAHVLGEYTEGVNAPNK